MKNQNLAVGFDGYAEAIFNQQAKEKLSILNEACKLASQFVEIERLRFAKSFGNYVFNELIKAEPEAKRMLINAEKYCELYNIPLSELNSLHASYMAIKGDFTLSECGTYFLKQDFTIYLTNEEQIRSYEDLNKLCKLLNSGCKRFVQRSVIEQGLNGYIKHDSAAILTPNVNRIKQLK